ncbi:MAG: SRPBCC family protein [bacterium]|nr:SRPBCC family protein [bacterium]
MKFLLKLLVAIISLAGILLIIALFVDGSFEVKRSETIPASTDVTFNYFKNLEHQEDFAVWLQHDADTKIWYEGTPGEVGYKMHWKSSDKRVGTGAQEIVAIESNERIDYKINVKEPEEIEADLSLHITQNGTDRSTVTWHVKGEVPYPWNLSLLFKDVEGQIGNELEKGLKNARPMIGKSE